MNVTEIQGYIIKLSKSDFDDIFYGNPKEISIDSHLIRIERDD